MNGLGDGLTEWEAGVRLHYLVRPDLRPYVGYSLTALSGRTADIARDVGKKRRKSQVLAGLSFWF